MNTTPPKRPPVFAVLAFVSALVAWLLFCWIINPPGFLKDDTGHKFFFSLMSMYFCQGCGFVFAVLALARRERFPALPVSALIVVLTIVGLILGAMVLMTTEHMNGR